MEGNALEWLRAGTPESFNILSRKLHKLRLAVAERFAEKTFVFGERVGPEGGSKALEWWRATLWNRGNESFQQLFRGALVSHQRCHELLVSLVQYDVRLLFCWLLRASLTSEAYR